MTQQLSPSGKQALNDSHFYMWRCVIAIVLADGVYHPTERKFLDKAFTALESAYELTNEHRKIFSDDLKAARNIDELLPQVTEPGHRALLPYFGQVITHIDGKQDPKEVMFLKNLETKVWAPGLEALHTEIQQAISAGKTQRRFKLIDFLLERLGIGPLD
ncbi:MAG: hypothetical protein ACAH83_13925 [Alphaproteobacteria bacterium]